MTTARDEILRDIRRTLPAEAALPTLDDPWIQYEDAAEQFLESLHSVGGVGKRVSGRTALQDELRRLAEEVGSGQICSVLPEFAAGNVDLRAVDDPHQLADVNLAILPGELAVAENAAVWITASIVPERVLYFLSQHVALVVPAEQVVNNMHEAYDWLHQQSAGASPFAEPKWGSFMSGPSKTADIEQALVIGAHGARSLHVYLLSP